MRKLIDRRGFGRICAAIGAAAVSAPVSWAEDLPHVDESSPQAKALGYHHDATKVDKTKFANYVEGSLCATCALYQGGAEWGPCGIFPGQLVNANGWCSAWAKKPA